MRIINEGKYGHIYYLYDESNTFLLNSIPKGFDDIYKSLLLTELGSIEYLFEEAKLFYWTKIGAARRAAVEPTDELINNAAAWVREIKINSILE
jgi:hypothetical protein